MDTSYILSLPSNIIQSLMDYTGSDYEEINRRMRQEGSNPSFQGREMLLKHSATLI
ncbi:Hypothetical protein BRZCDTV_431 [Brazilian cedratvirus IHUMI]|uniref:Uncharacterized protein n=1 Tax=Brazilian cedratvirus IHUMI TaxID=2126980 RepID=A0A2R8FF41_9VIRU|nr:Hypothetical protein BRZCDTV_431 [Brazilian cedratvirus IHUMI]